jgi:hypothetical protein
MLKNSQNSSIVAIQMRVGSSLFETLFPVIFAVLIWAGIFPRYDRLRSLAGTQI